MRVIVLMNSLYTGGAEFSTLTFYQWLQQQGHEIMLVCVKPASPSYDPQQFDFHKVHYLPPGSFMSKIKSFNQLVRNFHPAIVHSVLFEANMLGRISRMRLRNFIHIESLVNEMYSDYRLADPRITKFKLEGYRWLDRMTQHFGVDHFQANGMAVAKHYQQKLDIHPKRITVIPRGRKANTHRGDLQVREKIRNEFQTGNRLLIIQVGRHEYQKAQDVLLEAIHKLNDWKDKIRVMLVGREGNYTSLINERIKDFHMESTVIMAGHRNDVSSLLAASDIFVFPSRFEGLPGALIEAEAAGLPIVCSDIANNREVVEEGKNALVFAPNDSAQMAAGIRKLLADESLRRKMGNHSLSVFLHKFQLEEVHMKMEELLKRLVEKKRLDY